MFMYSFVNKYCKDLFSNSSSSILNTFGQFGHGISRSESNSLASWAVVLVDTRLGLNQYVQRLMMLYIIAINHSQMHVWSSSCELPNLETMEDIIV